METPGHHHHIGHDFSTMPKPWGPPHLSHLPPPAEGHSPHPQCRAPTRLCPPPGREIEFLKKETAQRRVLEESELAHKEEMEKLQEKVGTGRRDAGCP